MKGAIPTTLYILVSQRTYNFLFILVIISLNTYAQEAAETIIYKTGQDIIYREGPDLTNYMKERCRLDIYYPENKENFSTVVWFHGGGLRAGNKYIAEQLKGQGFAVAAANYRFHPIVKNPAYIEDAAAAVAWVFKNISSYGGDPSKIFVSGHSAGGYQTSMIGLDKSYLRIHGINADSIAALIPFSGHAITHFTIREERDIAGTVVVVDEFAPISHIRKGSPPYIIITGDRELEILGRYEENAYMYRMMKVIGHEETYLHELDGFDHRGMVYPAFYILRDYVKNYSK